MSLSLMIMAMACPFSHRWPRLTTGRVSMADMEVRSRMVVARQSSLGLMWRQDAGGDAVAARLACLFRGATREGWAGGGQVLAAAAGSTCRSVAQLSALGTVSHDDGAEGATSPRGGRHGGRGPSAPLGGPARSLAWYFGGLIAVYAGGLTVFWPAPGTQPRDVIFLVVMMAPTVGALLARILGGGRIQLGRPGGWWLLASLLPVVAVLVVDLLSVTVGWTTFQPTVLVRALVRLRSPSG